MIFEHVNLDIPDIKTQNVDGKRYYVNAEGTKYPSITTVLSVLSRQGIMEWRKRVGAEVANAISTRIKPTVLSLGSGSGCDAQYLFACDILLTTSGHVPKHSKSYRNFLKEFKRLQDEREAAFQEFYDDVRSGAFPEKSHIVEIEKPELEDFLNSLEKRKML